MLFVEEKVALKRSSRAQLELVPGTNTCVISQVMSAFAVPRQRIALEYLETDQVVCASEFASLFRRRCAVGWDPFDALLGQPLEVPR